MQITVEVPEEFAAQVIPAGKSPGRAALELLALEALPHREPLRGAGAPNARFCIRFEVHALLKEHQIPFNYSVSDFEDDLETVKKLQARRSAEGRRPAE